MEASPRTCIGSGIPGIHRAGGHHGHQLQGELFTKSSRGWRCHHPRVNQSVLFGFKTRGNQQKEALAMGWGKLQVGAADFP